MSPAKNLLEGKRILITGGTGSLGKVLLRRLLSVMSLVSIREFIGQDPWPGLRDEDDAPIWATAVAAG